MTEKYNGWDVLDELPDGWIIDKTAGSPAPLTVFITNGKSVLNGQKRALLKVKPAENIYINKNITISNNKENKNNSDSYVFPAQSVNILARNKFKEQILKEILFDLMVCEIEGWDKKEYIKEIKKLINSIDISKQKNNTNTNTKSLFD